jgi:hypothetical protein
VAIPQAVVSLSHEGSGRVRKEKGNGCHGRCILGLDLRLNPILREMQVEEYNLWRK